MWPTLDLSASLHDRMREALDQFARVGFGLAEAVVIYGLAWAVSRLVRRPLRRRLRRTLLPENVQALIVAGLRIVLFLIATSVLFGVWGLTLSGFLAAVSISTIILALGFQAALQSFLAGILILFERPFGVGDRIKFSGQDIEGVVTDIGMRSLTLKNDRGERITAPNALIFTLGVTNQTPNRTIRTVLRITDIGTDGQGAREAILRALSANAAIPAPGEIRFRTRFAKPQSPLGELSGDLPAALGRVTQSVVSRVRDADVIWAGVLDPTVLEQARRMLEPIFPESDITKRTA